MAVSCSGRVLASKPETVGSKQASSIHLLSYYSRPGVMVETGQAEVNALWHPKMKPN